MQFRYDVRDLKFILKEWLPSQEVFSCDRFNESFSVEDIDMVLNEAYKVAREVVSPINAPGDRVGARFEKGAVTPAPGSREVFRFLQQNGWGSSSECIQVETGMPLILFRAAFELFTAACPGIMSYIKLTSGAANLILRFGTDRDRALFIPRMLSGDWQGTMCITEPNAGSDVGDILARAYPTGDPGLYKIKGTKIFITGGDSGLCENTIHMVLARPQGGAAGSSGIGLYIVPRIWVEEDGSLGRPNDVTTGGIEHKMGLHIQATTLLNFGEEDACTGILVGPPPDAGGQSNGLAMMFHMMNESRIGTGHNAIAQAAAACSYASRYAMERIQGRPFGVKGAERCPIIRHADVRRMLLDMKAHVEGIRAMTFKGYYYLDLQANSSDRARARQCGELAEILTPLVKCYGSETSLGLIAEAMQVLGGVGYTREYPVEQYLRDSKILTIWEGTSFIHGNDLVGRKMRSRQGAPFAAWMATIKDFTDTYATAPGFEKEMVQLARGYRCMEEVKAIYDSWYANMGTKTALIPLYAVKALFVCAQVQAAQCLMEQALIAQEKLGTVAEDSLDATYYRGKMTSARYYLNSVLPNAFLAVEQIRSEDDLALTCPEEVLVVR